MWHFLNLTPLPHGHGSFRSAVRAAGTSTHQRSNIFVVRSGVSDCCQYTRAREIERSIWFPASRSASTKADSDGPTVNRSPSGALVVWLRRSVKGVPWIVQLYQRRNGP